MKFRDRNQYEILAGEYVLGCLSGLARHRFETYLQKYPYLQGAVDEWEGRFNAVTAQLEPVDPPPRVWENLCEAIPELRRRFESRGLWASLNLWKPLALLASTLALVLMVYMHFGPQVPELTMPMQVAMIEDPKSQQPAWMVGVMPDHQMIKVTAMHTPEIPTDKSCELWMLPGKDKAPVSLGLLPMNGTMMMPLSEDKMKILAAASGLAVSMEPKGGSPTGAPTGPVMYQGALYPI